jgi:hypothetical protein
MSFNGVKIMTIPKLGYKHNNLREGSLFTEYQKTLDPIEGKWWFSLAKKEYFFTNDRNITYETKI